MKPAKFSVRPRVPEAGEAPLRPGAVVRMSAQDPLWLSEQPDADLEEFRGRLRIDKSALDDECLQHPELYRAVSELYATAVAERDTAKEALAATDARLSEATRVAWAKTGEKTTEDRIKNAVLVHPEHVEAHRQWVARGRRAGILDGLRQAVESRGWMLRELAHLYSVGYFDTGAAKGASRDYGAARAQEAREGMAAARKGTGSSAKPREGKGAPS